MPSKAFFSGFIGSFIALLSISWVVVILIILIILIVIRITVEPTIWS